MMFFCPNINIRLKKPVEQNKSISPGFIQIGYKLQRIAIEWTQFNGNRNADN